MLRNKEIRRFTIHFLILTAAAVLVSVLLTGPETGLLVFFLAVCYGAAFFLFIRERYGRIARMSEQIDLVLHDQERLYIAEEEEGELSILQSEIGKMTVRIREQNAALRREKEYLADSLADIAHQLRTPLTSISLIVSLLEHDTGADRRQELLREAEDLLLRVDSLLTSLLKLSRMDAGIIVLKREPVEVEKLIHEALRPLLIPLDLHDVTVCVDIPEGAVVQGDPDWLSQAIQNILKNCMESAGDHGRIGISCEDTLLFIRICIHDNGPGFDEEDLPFVFDRFYRGKGEKASGYGIGLALGRSIITRSGGTVTAKNHPEGGAVFLVQFPK